MISLIAASSSSFHFMFSYQFSSSRFFPIVSVICPPKRQYPPHPKRQQMKQKKQNQFLFEFSDDYGCGVVRLCKKWEGEGDHALELELLEFMNNSKTPSKFPSKRDLIEAGRNDLVDAILKRSGWMSLGWEENEANRAEMEHGFNMNNSQDSASGQSIELAKEDSGIEGILNRLERERNLSFGLSLEKNGSYNHVSREFGQEEQSAKTSKDVEDSCHHERNPSALFSNDGRVLSDNGLNRFYTNPSCSSFEGDTWRTWCNQRSGISEFEVGEIEVDQDTNAWTVPTTMGSRIADTTNVHEPLENSSVQEIAQSDVKTHLELLKQELSSVIHSVRSNAVDKSEKVEEYMSEDLVQLSDASEFQENEVMRAQNKLRSMRAKLAVLEGKLALAINDAQIILETKQKRIDSAHKAIRLLCTTYIVWPNSGSEVLLAGSFDGWTTQRKMDRSSSGVFSLTLKLYPGTYEIKFIVDGSWKVDPLRPIVNHSGYENNLLIIT